MEVLQDLTSDVCVFVTTTVSVFVTGVTDAKTVDVTVGGVYVSCMKLEQSAFLDAISGAALAVPVTALAQLFPFLLQELATAALDRPTLVARTAMLV